MTERKLDVPGLAASYRRLVLWFGVQLVLGPGLMIFVGVVGESPLLGLVQFVVGLVVLGALAFYAYRTAVALGSRVGGVWAVAMFVPLLNVLTLLVLSSRATKACRAAGIKVGFFGPKDFEAPEEDRGFPTSIDP
jgi:hypothetical protein